MDHTRCKLKFKNLNLEEISGLSLRNDTFAYARGG